jgi:hypothetical protein
MARTDKCFTILQMEYYETCGALTKLVLVLDGYNEGFWDC